MIEVDYEEESDLENDSDPGQVHTSSHIDTSESNPQNLEIFKKIPWILKEMEMMVKIDLESDKGFKNLNKSSQKDQIDPNSPEVPGNNRFPEGETAEGDNDEEM